MDRKKRKRTKAEVEYLRFRSETDARERRARELVAKGLAELEEKRAQERRDSS